LVHEVHITEDKWGDDTQLPPFPSATQQERCEDLRLQTGATIGDPSAMVQLSIRLASERKLHEAADWYLKALQAEYPATFRNIVELLRLSLNAGTVEVEEVLKTGCGSGAGAFLFNLVEPDRRAFIQMITEALRRV
jgi:hypothetical protein